MWSVAFKRMERGGACTPLCVCPGVFSSGEAVLKGAWDPRKQKNRAVWLEYLRRWERRAQAPPQGHLTSSGWVAGPRGAPSMRGVRELACPRSERSGAWGGYVRQGVKKQGSRAKARTKREPRSSVPQRPLVSLDKAVPTLTVGWTGGQHHPHGQALPWVQPEPPGAGHLPGHGSRSLPRGSAEGSFRQKGPESFPPYQGALQGLVPWSSQLRVSHL